jgi:hypothetical protein
LLAATLLIQRTDTRIELLCFRRRFEGLTTDHALKAGSDFGFSSGIVTTSLKYSAHFKRNILSGVASINRPTVGVAYHVPFEETEVSATAPASRVRLQKSFTRP